MKFPLPVLVAFLALAPHTFAADTRSAPANHVPPPATIEDLSWLAGEWVGPGISGEAREVYSTPTGGAIAGHFVQMGRNGIAFYEIITIVPERGSLVYRLKHFNADLTGWEEKAEVRSFPLVSREGDAWYFDGLTVRRDGPDGMIGAVNVRMKDGTEREYVIRYRRAR
jgi:hypothetical protein